jgi:hypothetical protein
VIPRRCEDIVHTDKVDILYCHFQCTGKVLLGLNHLIQAVKMLVSVSAKAVNELNKKGAMKQT